MSLLNTGFFYQKLIDPALSSIHNKAIEMIQPNSKVIDVACGTGAFAFKIAKKAKNVLGIDLSAEMIARAKKTHQTSGLTNIKFEILDASDLHLFKKNKLDLATISLAIHQFSPKTALQILTELKRISKQILIVDYASPLPDNIFKPFIQIIERIAGREHSNNFRTFQKIGGISNYLNELKLETIHEISAGKGNFTIVLCS